MSYAVGNPAKIWKLTYEAKMSAASIAHYLGVERNYVYVALKRHRQALGLPALGMPRMMHELPVRKAPAGATSGRDESPRDARARVAAEVAAGKRCKKCCLLLPCFDHGERP